jgi:hypothetical protein
MALPTRQIKREMNSTVPMDDGISEISGNMKKNEVTVGFLAVEAL